MLSVQLLGPTELRWLLELRIKHVPAFRSEGASSALAKRMHAISEEAPNVFHGVDFHSPVDYTDLVAAAQEEPMPLEPTMPVQMQDLANQIKRKVTVLNDSGIPVRLEDGIAYARAELAIIAKVQDWNRPIFLFNTATTAWFFDTRAAFQVSTALSTGEIKHSATVQDTYTKGVMPPAMIFLPGFNEFCPNTNLAVQRGDLSVWVEFEKDFRGFLSRADYEAFAKCTLCHTQTHLPLTRCAMCERALCHRCYTQVACGCSRPTHFNIRKSECSAVTLDGALTRMALATQARPAEEPATMPAPLRRK